MATHRPAAIAYPPTPRHPQPTFPVAVRPTLLLALLLCLAPAAQAQTHLYFGKARFRPDWATFDAFRESYNNAYGGLARTPVAPFGNQEGYAFGAVLDVPSLAGLGRRAFAPIVAFGLGYEWHSGGTHGVFETQGGEVERRMGLDTRVFSMDLGLGFRIPVVAVTGTFGYYKADMDLRSSLVYPSGVESLGSDSPLNGKFTGSSPGYSYGVRAAVMVPKVPVMLTIRAEKRFVDFLDTGRDREIRRLTSIHDDSRSFYHSDYTAGQFREFTGHANEYRYAPDTLPRDWIAYLQDPALNAGPASKQGNVATDLGGFHFSVALALRLTP